MRALLGALCLVSLPALAADKPVVHFPDAALARLQVLQLVGEDALVEGPSGDVSLVRTGDLVGQEQARVTGVSKGCVALKVGRSVVSLCTDLPGAPRS
jgi:hypothetical protein